MYVRTCCKHDWQAQQRVYIAYEQQGILLRRYIPLNMESRETVQDTKSTWCHITCYNVNAVKMTHK